MSNNARFNFVATKMRPQRIIESADHRADEVICILECGHVHNGAPHFTYKVGSTISCNACGRIAALALPEFQGKGAL